MATTTNYSWTTPDDTALVKDGAAAIRSLGTAIDTTVFNNASAAIAKTIVDAKGDIIAATAADTVARLAVGANDQVLTADSSTATGLKWSTPVSGALTLLSTTSLVSLGSATLSLTSISQSYKNLYLLVNDAWIITTNGEITLGQNGSSGGNYGATWGAGGSGVSNSVFSGRHRLTNVLDLEKTTYPAFDCVISIYNYTSADTKMMTSATHFARQTYGYTGAIAESSIQNGAAITSLQLVSAGGNWNGGTVRLYGEN